MDHLNIHGLSSIKMKKYKEPAIEKLLRYRGEKVFLELLEKSDYRQLMLLYGHDTLLELLAELERRENFEECSKLKLAIEYHNKLANDKLKTK